ncbi:MAG TPA: hypothetical protein DCM39_02310 [Pantoea sp.]|nr:hypothetical protein [Pantoea sp.]
MKSISMMVVATLLGSHSFASVPAQQVTQSPLDQQNIGVISATGNTNLSSLEQQLSVRASDVGAMSFRITSTPGYNNLHIYYIIN